MPEVPPNTTFMDQFIDGGFAPVEFDGKMVPDYWADVEEGDRIRLEWLDSRSPREQGVVIRLRIPIGPVQREKEPFVNQRNCSDRRFGCGNTRPPRVFRISVFRSTAEAAA
jgi:hypothetical protein